MATTKTRSSRRVARKPAGRSFEELRSASGRATGNTCPRCRTNPRAGNVGVRLNKHGDEPGRYKQVASKHIGLCEDCCVTVYEGLLDAFIEDASGQ